jgi:hypothetical protein
MGKFLLDNQFRIAIGHNSVIAYCKWFVDYLAAKGWAGPMPQNRHGIFRACL